LRRTAKRARGISSSKIASMVVPPESAPQGITIRASRQNHPILAVNLSAEPWRPVYERLPGRQCDRRKTRRFFKGKRSGFAGQEAHGNNGEFGISARPAVG
jgi:hypothetical protein